MLLSNIIAQDISVHEALKKQSIREAILFLKSAWDELSERVIEQSWTKILNWDDKEYDEDDNMPLSELASSTEYYDNAIQETEQLLSKLAADRTLSVEEIENWNADNVDENEKDSDSENVSDDETTTDTAPVSYNEAITAVNTLIKWNERNTEYADRHMANLLHLRSDIVKKQMLKPPKQVAITDYFTRPSA